MIIICSVLLCPQRKVDQVGRRAILLAGSVGCTASMLLFVLSSFKHADDLWVVACAPYATSSHLN
eukprot:4303686-Amphidinium_carterae.1